MSSENHDECTKIDMTESLIHLRVPAATKGRWVRASRAAGLRLTDWVVEIIEEHMANSLQKISIPDGVSFGDLKLTRNADGSIGMDWGVVVKICRESGIPPEAFSESHEDNLGGMIVNWYLLHRKHGGEPDNVAEDLISEVALENAAGQQHSFEARKT